MLRKLYPKHLIPTEDLSLLSDLEINKSDYIGIWVDKKFRFKDPDGSLNPGVINIKHIPGFSCNKIPSSEPSDLKIEIEPQFKDKYLQNWNPGESGLIPSIEEFDINEERNFYFLKIEGIAKNGIYYKPFDDYGIEYTFTINVVHKPLVSNYWHFELAVDSDHGAIEPGANSRWINEMRSVIRKYIVDAAKFDLSDF